jgi:DsbC/DsbD-like thiol-disulfide interchange protein
MRMLKMGRVSRIAAGLALVLSGVLAGGQSDSMSRSVLRGAAVEYLYPEQVTVAAGKAVPVALHFRIAPGLHINSHEPREDYLIPTMLTIPEGAGVKLEGASYPAGMDLTLPIDPQTKLSVYTGEFTIQARLVATPGNHLVEAKLRFQACDKNACMPPKTIPVAIDVIGK